MSEDTSRLEAPTRRAFMSGIALTATAVVGNLYLGGTHSRDEQGERDGTSSEGDDNTDVSSPAATTPTPTATENSTPTATASSTPAGEAESGGHEHESRGDAGTPLAAFRHRLEDRFVPVESLSESDGRVALAYVSSVERAHEVAAGIETVVVSFIQTYEQADDWSVEGLDVQRVDDSGRTVGYWRLEVEWVQQLLKGTITRTELLQRTLDTYHGRLRRGHHHSGTGDGQNHSGDHRDHGSGDDGHQHEGDAGHQHEGDAGHQHEGDAGHHEKDDGHSAGDESDGTAD